MRAACGAIAALALLAGCEAEEKTLAQKAADDERAIAEVEAAQTPPPDVVTPERITADEREKFKLSDTGCSFAVNNPEIGAQAILQMNVGYMKFAGEMERFAPDAGSGDGPSGTSGRYDGGTHALLVQFRTAESTSADGDRVNVPTQVTLKDGRGRTVYVAEGTSLCG